MTNNAPASFRKTIDRLAAARDVDALLDARNNLTRLRERLTVQAHLDGNAARVAYIDAALAAL